MASFGASTVDFGGFLSDTAPANAAGGAVIRAGISATTFKSVRIVGNVASIVALLVPLYTFVRPVYKDKGVGDRTVFGFLAVFFTALFLVLYAIPHKHHDGFSIGVNSFAMAIEVLYVIVYLKYAWGGDKFDIARNAVVVVAAIASGFAFIVVFVVILTHVWSVKVVGIFAATSASLSFAVGAVDIVVMILTGRSAFTTLQLLANISAACIWIGFSSLSDPVDHYILIPNIVGLTVMFVQLVLHSVHGLKELRRRKNQPAAAVSV